MWEECSCFWARYQYIVIDQGNFESRPRLSRRTDEPPACGGVIQEDKNRHFELGACPRLQRCPSLQALHQRNRQQQQQQQTSTQHRMLRKRNAIMQTNDHGEEESMEERRKREFAEKFFRKRPVMPLTRVNDTADADHEDDNENDVVPGHEDATTEFEDEESEVLSEQAAASGDPVQIRRPITSAELSQSLDSTIIESGSEVESSDWEEEERNLPLRSRKFDSASSGIQYISVFALSWAKNNSNTVVS
ncbi:hypothetical protein HC256_001900 [Beauveria bassiana]|nr:hypothetical protein HC256_001900 [Beauveria bassiana]